MAKDYSEVKRRLDLPRVAYTVNPEGKLFPLICGRGVRGVLEASVEPFGSGDCSTFPAGILPLRIGLDDRDPVPWAVLRQIASAEIAEGRWLDVAEGRDLADTMDGGRKV